MSKQKQKTALIIGAGPAGLTLAYELITRTEYKPIIFEAENQVGGISKTINYKGNLMDLGGHRFFSKSQRVLKWWQKFLKTEKIAIGVAENKSINSLPIYYQGEISSINLTTDGPDPETSDEVFLIRQRLSRIFYADSFFNYPLQLNLLTAFKLGIIRTFKITASYIKALLSPIAPEKNLEDFFINRFGKRLYLTFFKDYTEKIWGRSCHEISADWGRQRIKGLSIIRALTHAIWQIGGKIGLKTPNVETSLIEHFLYPKYGPGQLWELVAEKIIEEGGEIHLSTRVDTLRLRDQDLIGVIANSKEYHGDLTFSTMPINHLVDSLRDQENKNPSPKAIIELSSQLEFRDFITAGLLFKKSEAIDLQDNWIYIQENGFQAGRVQIFNNWSPYLVKNPDTLWIGMEFFCTTNDEIWKKSDSEIIDLAKSEACRIGLSKDEYFLDGTVVRVLKAYPAYWGAYESFYKIREYIDTIPSLYLLGRNGMHRYNNQDHSMLTAMTAVDNIVNDIQDRDSLWEINTEASYHEEGSA